MVLMGSRASHRGGLGLLNEPMTTKRVTALGLAGYKQEVVHDDLALADAGEHLARHLAWTQW